MISRTTSQIKVTFPEHFAVEEGEWRLDVGRSNIIFERMRTAISHLHHDPQQQEEAIYTADRQLILQGTHLRDVLLRTFQPSNHPHAHIPLQSPDEKAYLPQEILEHTSHTPDENLGVFKNDMRIQSWAKRYSQVNPVVIEGDPVLDQLNSTQKRALAMMIGQRISLVQGVGSTIRYAQLKFYMCVIASRNGQDENHYRSH